MVRLLGGVDLASMQIAGRVQDAVVAPLVEVAPGGAPGREIDRQVAPLASGAGDVEDGIEDVPRVGRAGPSAAGLGGEVGFDHGPLGVGEVTGIVVRPQTPTTPVTPKLFPWWYSQSFRPRSSRVGQRER